MVHRYPKQEQSLGYLYPQLIEEWSSKNKLTSFDYYKSSKEKVYWTCPNGHEDYLCVVFQKINGVGCPTCGATNRAKNNSKPPFIKSLGAVSPEIAQYWSIKNPKTSYDVYPHSRSTYLWLCMYCNKEFEMSVHSRYRSSGLCKSCSDGQRAFLKSLPTPFHSFGDLYHDLLKEYSKENDRNPYSLKPGSKYRAKWVCSKCGHIWNTKIYVRTRRYKSGCPECGNRKSEPERLLKESLVSFGALSDSNFRLSSWKVDIYIPKKRVIVEYDGSYYHSQPKNYERDRRKSLELLSLGYKIIRIREQSSGYQLESLGINSRFYHEIFYENGLTEPYRKEPTEKLVETIRSLINND